MSLKLNTGFGVMAFVLVGSFYWNDLIRTNDISPNSDLVSGSRDLASIATANAPVVVSNSLATKLADREGLDKSQRAQRPSVFDKFAFEELQGKYSLEIASGKVRAFRFDTTQANSSPLSVPKMESFLNTHRNLWVVQFEKIKKVRSEADSEDVFELQNRENQKIGRVIFQKDSNGLWQGMEFKQ
jgi:hypothetical protein